MRNIEYGADSLHEKRTPNRDIAYTADFKKWLQEHKGAMTTAVSLIEDIELKLASLDTSSLSYKQLEESFWEEVDFPDHPILKRVFEKNGVKVSLHLFKSSHLYKVVVGETAFCVKREDKTRKDHLSADKMGGYAEIKSSASARELLKSMKEVEVIDFQLGYQDKKNGIRYFVSRWEPGLESANRYQTDKDHQSALLMKRIKSKLGDTFFEAAEHNMFYDPKRKKFIIYDLNSF